MVTKQEVLEYARECKRQRPHITDDDLRALLEGKFIRVWTYSLRLLQASLLLASLTARCTGYVACY
jgi:hypothetical protein